MPLLDHFRPPLSQRRHWDSFHGAWAEAIAVYLNRSLLPDGYVAEARVQLGGQVEIDVATFAEHSTSPPNAPAAVAVWAPPQPTASVPLEFQDPDVFEVHVFREEEGPQLVAAVELVSPANKDRPASRRMFAVKCASYLQSGVSAIVVDVITRRTGNLHAELLDLLQVHRSTSADSPELYATAYRTAHTPQGLLLQTWVQGLSVGNALPTLPLWLEEDYCLPLDLEATYRAACAARRIAC